MVQLGHSGKKILTSLICALLHSCINSAKPANFGATPWEPEAPKYKFANVRQHTKKKIVSQILNI